MKDTTVLCSEFSRTFSCRASLFYDNTGLLLVSGKLGVKSRIEPSNKLTVYVPTQYYSMLHMNTTVGRQ